MDPAIELLAASATLDTIVAIAQVIASLAAFAGLAFVGRQMQLTKRAERNRRTAELQERWDGREFRRVLSPVLAYLDAADPRDRVVKAREWMRASHGEEQCLPRTPRVAAAPHASKNDVLEVLGFVENLGAL